MSDFQDLLAALKASFGDPDAVPLYGVITVDRTTGRFLVLVHEKYEEGKDFKPVCAVDAENSEDFQSQFRASYEALGRRRLVLTNLQTNKVMFIPDGLENLPGEAMPDPTAKATLQEKATNREAGFKRAQEEGP